MEAPPGIYSVSWDTFTDSWTPQIPTDPRENTLFWQRCDYLGLSADEALTHGLEQLVKMETDLEANYYVLQSTMHQVGDTSIVPTHWEEWQELWDQQKFCNYNTFVGDLEEEFWSLYTSQFRYIGMNDTEERRDWLAELVYWELDIIRDYLGILQFEDCRREEMLAEPEFDSCAFKGLAEAVASPSENPVCVESSGCVISGLKELGKDCMEEKEADIPSPKEQLLVKEDQMNTPQKSACLLSMNASGLLPSDLSGRLIISGCSSVGDSHSPPGDLPGCVSVGTGMGSVIQKDPNYGKEHSSSSRECGWRENESVLQGTSDECKCGFYSLEQSVSVSLLRATREERKRLRWDSQKEIVLILQRKGIGQHTPISCQPRLLIDQYQYCRIKNCLEEKKKKLAVNLAGREERARHRAARRDSQGEEINCCRMDGRPVAFSQEDQKWSFTSYRTTIASVLATPPDCIIGRVYQTQGQFTIPEYAGPCTLRTMEVVVPQLMWSRRMDTLDPPNPRCYTGGPTPAIRVIQVHRKNSSGTLNAERVLNLFTQIHTEKGNVSDHSGPLSPIPSSRTSTPVGGVKPLALRRQVLAAESMDEEEEPELHHDCHPGRQLLLKPAEILREETARRHSPLMSSCQN
ncbi:hypothetical protein XELAEV_18016373mg [Xenopus laevis]|uniref:Uncharacterized protein n=1 Tax=Xenopus laevis TaxID=8355 RepID=A0A974DKE0_XENLA|nr:hypothetical protein XELAEV_18016373mg [Xenopus laevis]